MVDFVRGCTDTGAPEMNVSGVAGIERVSTNLMRISYFVRRKGDMLTVVHLVWDREEWLRQWQFWDKARADISHECFEIDGTGSGSIWAEKMH